MKKAVKLFEVIALIAIMGFVVAACGDGNGDNGNKTPVASDYEIVNNRQLPGNVIPVTITVKSGKSPGAISNIRYAGSTTVPLIAGTYAIYIDVAVATGWNAAADLFIGNFVVEKYNIGDTGPCGGKIFYYNVAGFTMTDNNQICHFLEAAILSQGVQAGLAWASSGFTSTYVDTAESIGEGRKNTALILAIDTDAPAARACNNYTGGGKNDWFLPSKDELNEIYKQKTIYSVESFWSSSQNSNYTAWNQILTNGSQSGSGSKANKNSVCAVRAF